MNSISSVKDLIEALDDLVETAETCEEYIEVIDSQNRSLYHYRGGISDIIQYISNQPSEKINVEEVKYMLMKLLDRRD